MSIFGDYARYYDLLYRDKDYIGEAKFIHDLIQTHAPESKNILELGCGTGNHATLLAQESYVVHGIDVSYEMLQIANERISQSLASKLTFTHGDIRQVRLNQKFDVVISLFHVISYQTTNQDLLAAFATAKAHLKPNGIFIFDVWYGPAVLTTPPEVRVKRLEDKTVQITRIAEPVIYPNENLVDVNYYIFIKDKKNNTITELQETHKMRYLFKPEIEMLIENSGLKIKSCQEWLTNENANFDTWNVYFLAKK
ncbi:MAG: class I SAM-dependent methyltransferase [Pseudanabaena sp. M135S2SP2A07QC]|uniref:class I SAM-dependent DNA methyltransferase n=1 Tax=Microcystis sp. M074S1 TaxID=2771126 RepID=UPI002588C53D|nr:class I SAM-dependent methyltransferase [Microcystis sp. M074S1]MCA6527168.1 class I SAM-dependent methyltransferase [Pseudanabaena sp. M179S2SP2A07QC]MCA6528858.1 class I SAM-dependent methyltransferase [Pseudanabaena sp. M125S2SP2A07QC]MCA6533393.1 class I SAM-dependent methyltransferase [Pseudanabaena sp. M176S2SP2A07QC]MCA6539267.1 class I SAM-dependent methyltransferase [Pseudanabaena sp. M037S2SP2A07QC]MCA6548142.1 class I SAM-dependent methyltransferase [Pseudanabaena sp. M152S2SP2A0